MDKLNQITNNFMKRGIAKGKSELLTISEFKELERLILNTKDKYLKKGSFTQNIIGIDKNIDRFIEKIITNTEVQSTLQKLLGDNYILRLCSVRYNTPYDKGLMMHQDSLGEIGLMILLNNQPDASTVFFPGSQLIPSNKKFVEMVSWNSLKLMKIAKYFLMRAKGDVGNYYYINKRTWHGRTPGKSNYTKISLFISFFPVSSKRKDLCTEDASYNDRKSEYNLVTEPNLRKIISRENYLSAIENFEKEINPEYSLSMKTHSNEQILKNKTYFVFMIFKIALLELLFIPIRLKRVFKVKW
tara:strand:- start:350 stop:1249 length:900 start_codon:yes stop_codon:yes gene_type:complete